MESVSHQLGVSARDKPNGGFPSALAVCSRLVAVGTTRGLVMVFERASQRLTRFYREPAGAEGRELGAVSCMDFSPDGGNRLAVGHSRGQLLVYDCSGDGEKGGSGQGKPGKVKAFVEPIQPDRGLLHVR